jgi:hypothetical protein
MKVSVFLVVFAPLNGLHEPLGGQCGGTVTDRVCTNRRGGFAKSMDPSSRDLKVYISASRRTMLSISSHTN